MMGVNVLSFSMLQAAPNARTTRRCRVAQGAEAGAAVIEFVIVFPVFFFLLYGLVTWGLIFGLQQSMTLAAQEGARAAVAVSIDSFIQNDGNFDQDAYDAAVQARVRSVVGDALGWLPASWKNHILGDDNAKVGVDVEPAAGAADEYVVGVVVSYPGYKTKPILPLLELPGLGVIPPVPERLTGRAVARL